jgi:cyanosortase A-associated protein
MVVWKRLRIVLLMAIFAGIVFVFGKLFLVPTVRNDSSSIVFDFPTQIPLAGWRSLGSRPLAVDRSNLLERREIAAQRYRYSQKNTIVEIEMRYFASSNGDVNEFVKDYTGRSPSLTTRQHKKIGVYGLFTRQQQAYLSACINPRGGSTVTIQQFEQNNYFYDLRWERLFPWLLGRQPLTDRRCLWTYMSVYGNSSPKKAYQLLESVWLSWFEWWSLNFPKIERY